jgi:plasmid stability protein
MNEIVIDLSNFPQETQDALKIRAVREGKPMKRLLAELIQSSSEKILRTEQEAKASEIS